MYSRKLSQVPKISISHRPTLPQIESQIRELSSEILDAHVKASRPMTHSEPPFVQVGNYRQQVWEDHLTSLDAEDGSLWGTARAFRKKASPISALNGPNGIALSDSKTN
ncbi:uncharacterized protein TNCV_3227871 [Trichonephila clavipes]|nr:uncharacterized protein TNCV_3227871 [Trichonephila clavipes]